MVRGSASEFNTNWINHSKNVFYILSQSFMKHVGSFGNRNLTSKVEPLTISLKGVIKHHFIEAGISLNWAWTSVWWNPLFTRCISLCSQLMIDSLFICLWSCYVIRDSDIEDMRLVPDMTLTQKKMTLPLEMGDIVHLPQHSHVLLWLCY